MACRLHDDCHKGLLRGAAGCSLDGKNGSQSKVSWLGIVSGGTGSRFVMFADVLNVQDKQDNAEQQSWHADSTMTATRACRVVQLHPQFISTMAWLSGDL